MAERELIDAQHFNLNVFQAFKQDWFLLAAGVMPPGRFNVMTIAWGSLGVMWDKPFVQVVVRPSRYTFELLEKQDTFTVSAFGPKYHDALLLCGTTTGRDSDKAKAAGLTPVPSTQVAAPGFQQADLILECRKIYADRFNPAKFLVPEIEPNYGGSDYHAIYYGQILAILGTPAYRR